jgi:hypothetical protein
VTPRQRKRLLPIFCLLSDRKLIFMEIRIGEQSKGCPIAATLQQTSTVAACGGGYLNVCRHGIMLLVGPARLSVMRVVGGHTARWAGSFERIPKARAVACGASDGRHYDPEAIQTHLRQSAWHSVDLLHAGQTSARVQRGIRRSDSFCGGFIPDFVTRDMRCHVLLELTD